MEKAADAIYKESGLKCYWDKWKRVDLVDMQLNWPQLKSSHLRLPWCFNGWVYLPMQRWTRKLDLAPDSWGPKCMHAKSLQPYLTRCDPIDCSLPGFSWQEYWSGLPFPSPGDLSDPGIKPVSPAALGLQADYLPLSQGEALRCIGKE